MLLLSKAELTPPPSVASPLTPPPPYSRSSESWVEAVGACLLGEAGLGGGAGWGTGVGEGRHTGLGRGLTSPGVGAGSAAPDVWVTSGLELPAQSRRWGGKQPSQAGGNPDGAGKTGMDGDLGPSSLPLPAPVLQVSCLSTEAPHQETSHHQAWGRSGGSGQGEGELLLVRPLPDAQASQQKDVTVGT